MRRSCFPNSSSHQHGPPLLGRVRTPPRSPTSTLLCSPPTPSLPSVAAPVSPRQRPTSVRRTCSSPLHRYPRRPVQRRRLFYPGSPSAGSLPKEKRGYPRCLGHPLHACRGPRPRRVQPPLARSRCGHRRLQVWQYPGHPEICLFRGCSTLGPHARVPTLRRIRYRLQRKARYRPGRAHPWPGGFRTRWMTTRFHGVIAYSLPPRPALPGRTTTQAKRNLSSRSGIGGVLSAT